MFVRSVRLAGRAVRERRASRSATFAAQPVDQRLPVSGTAVSREQREPEEGAVNSVNMCDADRWSWRPWPRDPAALTLAGEYSREGAVDGRVTTLDVAVHRPVADAGEQAESRGVAHAGLEDRPTGSGCNSVAFEPGQ